MRDVIIKSGLVLFLTIVNYTFCQEPGSSYNGKIEDPNSRNVYLLNAGWDYVEDQQYAIDDLTNKILPWQSLDLPHTWNALDPTDNNPGYRRDAGWYRKEIFVPEYPDDVKWQLYFEGVNISSDIFVNGKRAGGHIGGYIGFEIDMTAYLNKGQNNSILVRADNSVDFNIIPSQKSDFVIYGGITRDVWLRILPPVSIGRVLVSTPVVSSDLASTNIKMELHSKIDRDENAGISIIMKDPEGKTVLSKSLQRLIKKGTNSIVFDLPEFFNPLLWSSDNPILYNIELKVSVGEYEDTYNEKIGYRWFEFKENGPFLLNGKRLLLRGTHRHEEWAGYGNAMPNELHRKDMEMIKEMGANFVRLAHYPQDPEIYRACDELGLLVWDELPWCRGGMGDYEWQGNTKRLLKEQIRQNYNHPSIILWSLGNEFYWLPDFPGGDDPDSLRLFISELNEMSHELDPYRPTAMRKYYDGADITDVFSPSIWAGWYSGVYKTYEEALIKARKKYPRLIHTEYGGSSHVGRHTENPITGEGLVKENEWDEKPNMVNVKKVSSEGDWSENYIVDLFDWHLMVSEKLDWFVGNAQWAFKDFSTPLRPENPIPYVNQKGLVDRAGNPKDAYYVFKSYWTTDPAFVYIESHTWKERFGLKGEKKQVCIYSNCQNVKLELNGADLGTKTKDMEKFPASGLNWNVDFKEGVNRLIATGYVSNNEVSTDTVDLKYYVKMSGKPVEVILQAEEINDNKFLIEAKVIDKNGQICPEYSKRVYFDLNGGGKLSKYLGTPTGSDVIEFASGRAFIEFTPEPGKKSTIEARTQDFKGSYLFLNTNLEKSDE